MKILIGCEYSGIVREAFTKKGFDTYSCDILNTEIPSEKHFQEDIFSVLNRHKFDVLIGFPPCTYLSSAGLFLCNIELYGNKAIERIKKRNQAVEFFLDLYAQPIKHICLENPVGYISANILSPSQIIHPYYFGDNEMKRTCLWLKNLPLLEYKPKTDLFGNKTILEKPKPTKIQIRKKTGRIKNRYFVDSIVGNVFKSPKEKSKTFQAVANAMADQWSEFILNQ